MTCQSRNNVFAFLGSYAEEEETGIYFCRYNPLNGALTIVDQLSGLRNPTFLDVDPEKKILYVLAEEAGPKDIRRGIAISYCIDTINETLTELNRETTVDAPTCHIQLDHSRRCLFTASYHGGLVGLSPIQEDGCIGPIAQVFRHSGSSILPAQNQARAHSVFPDPANRYAVVCDLGMDQIVSYKLDPSKREMCSSGITSMIPGSGPRHFSFHPNQPYAYVINELNSTITAFSYVETSGQLTAIQTISTLPKGYSEDNSTADIHLSPDGRFLYGSNRGHDSIAVFSVDLATGLLTLVEIVSTEGGHPRNFALSLDGRFLLVANRDGDNVVTFARDSETGCLHSNGQMLSVSKPVCLKFAEWME